MTRRISVSVALVGQGRRIILGGSLGLCLLGLGLLQEVLTVARNNREALWPAHLRTVEHALEKADVNAAVRAWHDAYGAALGSGRWEGMVEVGDAFLRIGEVSGARTGSKPNARRAYRVAFIRAVQQGSADGLLRVAEAFAALGDRAVATQCLRIAARLAAEKNDTRAGERVRAFAARWKAQLPGAESSESSLRVPPP